MEFLNRIELTGKVGNVRITEVGNSRVARFSVRTDYCFTDREGYPTIETTWHSVSVWEKTYGESLDNIKKDANINVKGRLRSRKLVGEGGEYWAPEIVAYDWKIVE